MDEYIEREAVIEKNHGGVVYIDDIKNIPSADVSQVRHGRWIETPRLCYGAKQYECSLCYSDTFWNKHSIYEK